MPAITNYFSSFYDFARRHLDLKPKLVDELITLDATASIAGRTVVFTVDERQAHIAHIGIGHAKAATRWVNTFNERATRATPKLDATLASAGVNEL